MITPPPATLSPYRYPPGRGATFAAVAAAFLVLFAFIAGTSPARAADEVPTIRIRSTNNAWTVQQLDSEDSWHPATIRVIKDGLTYMEELGSVRLRGSSSAVKAEYVKKNYTIEFRDAAGNDKKVEIPFVGLAKESDFTLQSNFWDPTHARNAVTYKLYRNMGRWAPRARYVNLVVNGEYRGLYGLTEKIKRSSARVNIPKVFDRNDGVCSVQGGFIYKRDGDDPNPDFASSVFPDMRWWMVYPDAKVATPNQAKAIRNHVSSIDQWFSGNAWTWNYENLIDVGSYVDYSLITELTMNGDGYWKSFYHYTTVTPECQFTKLVMGPPWDYDLAYGNSGGGNWEPASSCDANSSLSLRYPNHPHLKKLWTDSAFRSKLKSRWSELRANVLSEASIMKVIDDHVNSTVRSREEDKTRWSAQWPVRNGTVWPAPCDKSDLSLQGEIEALKRFLRARLVFLDRHIGSL